MNKFVERYKFHRNNGRDPITAFGIIASSIAVTGTMHDLKEVDKEFQKDLWSKGDVVNETVRINRAI